MILEYIRPDLCCVLQGERPLYLQLDPPSALMAKALVKLMEANHWFYASLITEDTYAMDGFLDTFRQYTADTRWRVEDYIVLSRTYTKEQIDYKLLNLLENKSRVIVLHSSWQLARLIFQVASLSGFTEEGYALVRHAGRGTAGSRPTPGLPRWIDSYHRGILLQLAVHGHKCGASHRQCNTALCSTTNQ